MSEPAPAPAPAPAFPHAQPAFAPPVFAPPMNPAAALDITAPLTHGDHPTSLAMPVQQQQTEPIQTMPSFANSMVAEAPAPIGGVASASSCDLADLHAALDARAATSAGVSGTGIWSPATALVIAVAALTVQLVSFYARVSLPAWVASGEPLDNFDSIVGNLPLFDSMAIAYLAMLAAAGSIALILFGYRRGVRELGLQVAVGVLGTAALFAAMVLPVVTG